MSKHGILSKDNDDDKDNIFSKVLSGMKSVFNNPTCVVNKDGTPVKGARMLTFTTDKQKQTFTITDLELPQSKTLETHKKDPTTATSSMQSLSPAISSSNFSIGFSPLSSHIQSVEDSRSHGPLTELSTLEIIDNKSHDILCETVLSLDEFMPKDSSVTGTSGTNPADSNSEDIDLNVTVPSTDSDLINIEDEPEFRLTDLSVIPNTEPVKLNLCETIEDQNTDFSIKQTQSRPSVITNVEILGNADEEGQKIKLIIENEDASALQDSSVRKLSTPRKKKEKKGKDREVDNETSDSSTTKSERGENRKMTRSTSKPREEKCEINDPKPRIVLTFRSEKIGPKMRNMTVVSEEDKGRDQISTRRSARVRKSVESFDPVVTPRLHTRRSTGATLSESNSDEADKTNTDPILKRSTRRRSKEFSDNVLANAIARKEKSYNENPPSQRLSRRIKPTAKVLANRELRLGLETQNNVRLGLTLDKSPDQIIQPRRSGRRRRSVELTDFTPTSRSPRIKKTPTGGRRRSRQYSDDDKSVLKSEEQYLSIDDINNCILGTVDGKSGWPSKSESRHARETSEEREIRRLNKMKRKHLGKLGLKAVSPTELGKQRTISEDNLTDDSTMDSTNTEAIAEHLHAQHISLVSEMERIAAEKAKVEEELLKHTEETKPKLETMAIEEKEVHIVDRQHVSTAVDEETPATEEVSKRVSCSEDEGNESCPRVTRKRMRSAAASHCSSPAGGEEGADAEPPTEAASGPTCLCEQPSNFYASQTVYTEILFCRAIDSVNGRRVGCSHEARPRFIRASCRTPYVAACIAHGHRMRLHHSCPACGMFCTEGSFSACASGHLSHTECATEESACEHCGAPTEVVSVRTECKERGVFMPKQTVHDPAYMSFASKAVERPPDLRVMLRTELVPHEQLDRLHVSREDLLCDGANASEAFRLLRSTIVRAAKDLLSAQAIVDAILISGPLLDSVSGVTVASRCGCVLALCLLEYAGARINICDGNMRTPLHHAMLGLNYVMKGEKPLTGIEEEKPKRPHKLEDEVQGEPVSRTAEDYLQVVQYLIAAGCDVAVKDESGRTVLHQAALLGSIPACNTILESGGARLDECDILGDTPIAVAAAHEHHQLIGWLANEGADVNISNVQGYTALHVAAHSGCTHTLLALLDAGAAVNMRANDGDTALHIAARKDHYNAVVILLARGAMAETLNEVGETAIDCAGENTHALVKLNAQLGKMVKNKSEQLMSSDISNGRELLPVECVNGLDDEELPPFNYTTRMLYTHNLRLDSTLATLQGCDCKSGVCDATTCACVALAVRPWYRRGRLASDFPHHDPPVLFECNRTCGCNPRTCTNRIVGRAMLGGSALWVRARVCRGGAGGGWALRAAAPAVRGSPLALYAGELLPAGRAAKRDNHHYMFALSVDRELAKEEQDGQWLTVDGSRWGSAARFANHSCRGTTSALRVLTEHRDLRAPHIVLFATRDVKAGEDITFDYGDKFWSMKGGRMRCECGEPCCRYPGPSTT